MNDPLRHRLLFREVNERIREIHAEFRLGGETVQLFCECGRGDCLQRLEIPAVLYDRVRAKRVQFLVAAEHHARGRERVVEEGGAYVVVASGRGSPRSRRRRAAA